MFSTLAFRQPFEIVSGDAHHEHPFPFPTSTDRWSAPVRNPGPFQGRANLVRPPLPVKGHLGSDSWNQRWRWWPWWACSRQFYKAS